MDLNLDGEVSIADLLIFLDNFGCINNCPFDLTGDGLLTTDDLQVLIGEMGCLSKLRSFSFFYPTEYAVG